MSKKEPKKEMQKEQKPEKENSESSLNEEEISEDQNKSDNFSIEDLKEQLSMEKQKAIEFEDKFKRTLADFQNLQRKSSMDIENGVNAKMDSFIVDFLQIYDDFLRAKKVFSDNNIDTKGLDSILKNIDHLLSKYQIRPMDSLGELFDPKIHEAISIIEDSSLDDNTITKEIRKGYISHNRVIRPALVEISKKSKSE